MDEPLAQNDEFLKLVERNKQIIEELKQLNIEKDELALRPMTSSYERWRCWMSLAH